MNVDNYDLIIAGAGPAGLCLVRELADSNFRILLLDKKRNAEDVQYNTSGSFIKPDEWKIPNSILNPITKIYFGSYRESVIKNVAGYVIDRKKLLSFLESKSKRNNNLLIKYNSKINEISHDQQGIKHIIYSDGKENIKATAKLFIDCSGISAIFGKRMGIIPDSPTLAVGIEYLVPLIKDFDTADLFMSSSLRGGYGWIFPKDSTKAIVGYGTLSKNCFSGIESNLKGMWAIKRVSERCKLKPLEKNIGILRTGRPLRTFFKNNVLIIGDSALQANTLVGEGIRFVMDSARMAAKWIVKSVQYGDMALLQNYSRDWRKKYHKQYKLGFKLQQILKIISTNDKILDFGVRRLKKLSDYDYQKLLSGDLNYSFLIKLLFKSCTWTKR